MIRSKCRNTVKPLKTLNWCQAATPQPPQEKLTWHLPVVLCALGVVAKAYLLVTRHIGKGIQNAKKLELLPQFESRGLGILLL